MFYQRKMKGVEGEMKLGFGFSALFHLCGSGGFLGFWRRSDSIAASGMHDLKAFKVGERICWGFATTAKQNIKNRTTLRVFQNTRKVKCTEHNELYLRSHIFVTFCSFWYTLQTCTNTASCICIWANPRCIINVEILGISGIAAHCSTASIAMSIQQIKH